MNQAEAVKELRAMLAAEKGTLEACRLKIGTFETYQIAHLSSAIDASGPYFARKIVDLEEECSFLERRIAALGFAIETLTMPVQEGEEEENHGSH